MGKDSSRGHRMGIVTFSHIMVVKATTKEELRDARLRHYKADLQEATAMP